MDASSRTPRQVRVLRVIARLNMGGPAHHVGILGSMLDPARYDSLLLHGDVGAGEDSLEELVKAKGLSMAHVPGLRPELRPADDARALRTLTRRIRELRPDIVHTHTAKAGMLGRAATVMAGAPRPLLVHTYHGHVLEGYFGPGRNALYRSLERRLATVSDALIGVSSATVDDLVRLRIAERSKFRMIPIGLDLDAFVAASTDEGRLFRAEVGADPDDLLLTFVGRLAPIKRVDVLLRAFHRAHQLGAPVRLAIVGDGALRAQLERLARELGVGDRVHFAGYRADVVPVAAAADIAVLSSDNEGTPVSLIEAAAAGKPAVSTRAGGVADVVRSDTGVLVERGDHEALGSAIAELSANRTMRLSMGAAARSHALAHFSNTRLVHDIDELYRELLEKSRAKVDSEASTRLAEREHMEPA